MTNFQSFTVAETKKRAKLPHLRVCGDSWTFACSSKTVQNGCIVWIARRLILCPHDAQC